MYKKMPGAQRPA